MNFPIFSEQLTEPYHPWGIWSGEIRLLHDGLWTGFDWSWAPQTPLQHVQSQELTARGGPKTIYNLKPVSQTKSMFIVLAYLTGYYKWPIIGHHMTLRQWSWHCMWSETIVFQLSALTNLTGRVQNNVHSPSRIWSFKSDTYWSWNDFEDDLDIAVRWKYLI